MTDDEHWDTTLLKSSPIIKQLNRVIAYFLPFTHWPSIDDYKQAFTNEKLDVTPVPQSHDVIHFEDQYEPRVYLKKELQTRTENWHDFFNAMIWLQFPKTKTVLNQLHFSSASNREKGSNRSTLENRITQFDECGALIISDNEFLLELLKQHRWQELFVENKALLESSLRCIVFGHAIHEKALAPYIGMTCHCLLTNDKNLLSNVINNEYSAVDKFLSDQWKNEISANPGKFHAFPILGLPNYWPKQDFDFYSNKKYFRK